MPDRPVTSKVVAGGLKRRTPRSAPTLILILVFIHWWSDTDLAPISRYREIFLPKLPGEAPEFDFDRFRMSVFSRFSTL
jgi:hypothetical protein